MQGFGNYDPNKGDSMERKRERESVCVWEREREREREREKEIAEKTILEKMKDKVMKEEKPGPYKPYVKPTGFEFSNYGAG